MDRGCGRDKADVRTTVSEAYAKIAREGRSCCGSTASRKEKSAEEAAGAVLVEETHEMIRAAGFVDAKFEERGDYMDRMSEWVDPLYREIVSKLPAGTKPSDFVTSLSITATKPREGEGGV
jgi:hypothetical protein